MSGIDISSLVEDISPDATCGEDLEYDPAFVELNEQVKGVVEKQIGEKTIPGQPPNWPVIRKNALALLNRTRDLRIIDILIQASVHSNDFTELNKCVIILATLLEEQWDSLHPRLDSEDDNDSTQRINILMGLCDFNAVVQPVTRIPLVESPLFGKISFRDIQIAHGRLSPVDADNESALDVAAINAAFSQCELADLKAQVDIVADSLGQIARTEAAVQKHTEVDNAINLSSLTDVLTEIHKVLIEHADKISAENRLSANIPTENGERATSSDANAGMPNRPIQSRQDVICVLGEICAYYKRNEPSSPVPILLNRAKRLVAKDFMDIMRDMVPDGVSQVETLVGKQTEDH